MRAAVLGLSLLGAVPLASAQVPEDASTLVTIPVGPVLLHPFLVGSMERTDNVFQESGSEGEHATVTTVIPGFVAQLPFSHSRASLGYALRHRDYSFDGGEDSEVDPWSHYLRAETQLVFGTGWYVSLRDDFRRGVLDTRIFEGGEVRFTGEELSSNHVAAEVGVERANARDLRLSLQHLSDRVVGERRSGFFDVREDRAGLAGDHHVASATWFLWEVEGRDSTHTRGAERREGQELRGRLGVRRRIPGGVELEGLMGVVENRFLDEETAAHRNVVGSAGLRLPFDRSGVVAARVAREVYPSVLDDRYYVVNGVQLEIASDRDSRLGLGTSAGYYLNRYPTSSRGKDRTLAVETWIGYRPGRWGEARLTVRGATRSSAVLGADFAARSVALEIRMGGS